MKPMVEKSRKKMGKDKSKRRLYGDERSSGSFEVTLIWVVLAARGHYACCGHQYSIRLSLNVRVGL